MTTRYLSPDARRMLHAIIWDSKPNYWMILPDLKERNKALHELRDHRLIEVDLKDRRLRATDRGRTSNARTLQAGLLHE